MKILNTIFIKFFYKFHLYLFGDRRDFILIYKRGDKIDPELLKGPSSEKFDLQAIHSVFHIKKLW